MRVYGLPKKLSSVVDCRCPSCKILFDLEYTTDVAIVKDRGSLLSGYEEHTVTVCPACCTLQDCTSALPVADAKESGCQLETPWEIGHGPARDAIVRSASFRAAHERIVQEIKEDQRGNSLSPAQRIMSAAGPSTLAPSESGEAAKETENPTE